MPTITTAVVHGLNAELVDIVNPPVPASQAQYRILAGFEESAVRSMKGLICCAITESLFDCPSGYYVSAKRRGNSDLLISGDSCDLAVALAIIQSSGQLDITPGIHFVVGSLSMTGDVRYVRGILPMVEAARDAGFARALVPRSEAREASMASGIDIIPISTLGEACGVLEGRLEIRPYRAPIPVPNDQTRDRSLCYSDAYCDPGVLRGLQIAAVGGHNVLMMGPPGSGKSMLARRFTGILPEMTDTERLDVVRIYSASGLYSSADPIVRPFRAPHHTISEVGLAGGGTVPRPGEMSLAHNGVLFLDELPEFRRNVLDSMIEPIRNGMVRVIRRGVEIAFPSRFQLIAAMNSCPCGYDRSTRRPCQCTPERIDRYRRRIDVLRSRFDIVLIISDKRPSELGETSRKIRERVSGAVETLGSIDDMTTQASALLLQYSAAGLNPRKLERVAASIAALDGSSIVECEHVSTARSYVAP